MGVVESSSPFEALASQEQPSNCEHTFMLNLSRADDNKMAEHELVVHYVDHLLYVSASTRDAHSNNYPTGRYTCSSSLYAGWE